MVLAAMLPSIHSAAVSMVDRLSPNVLVSACLVLRCSSLRLGVWQVGQ
jgi:hypothetical protein